MLTWSFLVLILFLCLLSVFFYIRHIVTEWINNPDNHVKYENYELLIAIEETEKTIEFLHKQNEFMRSSIQSKYISSNIRKMNDELKIKG